LVEVTVGFVQQKLKQRIVQSGVFPDLLEEEVTVERRSFRWSVPARRPAVETANFLTRKVERTDGRASGLSRPTATIVLAAVGRRDR